MWSTLRSDTLAYVTGQDLLPTYLIVGTPLWLLTKLLLYLTEYSVCKQNEMKSEIPHDIFQYYTCLGSPVTKEAHRAAGSSGKELLILIARATRGSQNICRKR